MARLLCNLRMQSASLHSSSLTKSVVGWKEKKHVVSFLLLYVSSKLFLFPILRLVYLRESWVVDTYDYCLLPPLPSACLLAHPPALGWIRAPTIIALKCIKVTLHATNSNHLWGHTGCSVLTRYPSPKFKKLV